MREPPDADLAAVEAWVQAVTTHPGDVAAAVAAAARATPFASADAVVLPSASLDAAGRIGVYHGMYALRLERVLAADFPATCELLGAEAFSRLARAYVAARPSRSFTLDGYGRALPEFLAAADVPEPLRAAAADLARLERAASAAREPSPVPPVAAARLAALAPDAWPRARLVPVPGASFASYAHDVAASFEDWRADRPVRRPARRPKRLATFRRDDRTRLVRIARREAPFLDALVAGLPLSEALEHAAAAGLRPSGVRDALARWCAAGLFVDVA